MACCSVRHSLSGTLLPSLKGFLIMNYESDNRFVLRFKAVVFRLGVNLHSRRRLISLGNTNFRDKPDLIMNGLDYFFAWQSPDKNGSVLRGAQKNCILLRNGDEHVRTHHIYLYIEFHFELVSRFSHNQINFKLFFKHVSIYRCYSCRREKIGQSQKSITVKFSHFLFLNVFPENVDAAFSKSINQNFHPNRLLKM